MANSGAGKRGALTVLKAITWVVYALATAAVIILAFGFVLVLLGASTESGFSAFIYQWSVRFMGPFAGMVVPTKAGAGFVSWNALIAIAAYAVLAWLIGAVLNSIDRSLARSRTPQRAPAPAPAAPPNAAATYQSEPPPAPVVATEAEAEPVSAPQPAPVSEPAPQPVEGEAPVSPETMDE